MPDVDWEKVAEALDEFVAFQAKEVDDSTVPTRPAVVVGWRAEALAEIIAAARWGLEAQQRGVEAHLSSVPLDIGGLMWRVTVPHVLGTFMEGPHLLVPLEGEQ